jgi:hypothetical protein
LAYLTGQGGSPARGAEAGCSQQQQQQHQWVQQRDGEGVEEQEAVSLVRRLEPELGENDSAAGDEAAVIEDTAPVGLNGEMCWWWAEAQKCISAGCPAAQALDVQPQHVLGVGLDQLSTCQLEALEVKRYCAQTHACFYLSVVQLYRTLQREKAFRVDKEPALCQCSLIQ